MCPYLLQDVFEFPSLEIEAGGCELTVSVFDCNRFSPDARIGEAALRCSREACCLCYAGRPALVLCD